MSGTRLPSWMGPAAVVAVVVVAAMVATAGVVMWLRPQDAGPAPSAGHSAAPIPAPPHQRVAQRALVRAKPVCQRQQARHRFAPRTVSVQGVTRGAFVVAPPRDAYDVPGVPPLTSAGKVLFAWDRAQGVEPGDRVGNVLLNAHTWPDGSALGNRLLAGVHRGSRIVVRGEQQRLCYRVTEKVEVLASDGLPRYYDKTGPPQLAILVCSGRRLGPGNWSHRTVWFAAPVRAAS